MKKIISFLLIVTTLFTMLSVFASAASKEEFISEVALVYEDSVEDARAAIAGTDWKLFEQDLNPGADFMFDDGVYLIYKTTTNVEEAITDLRVMDMYGGYSNSNYDKQLEASRNGYLQMVKYIRAAAAEFKTLYEAGDEMARLAYRQMNYYKDMKTENGTETDMLMGDFMLNIPSDEALVTVMMEGNYFIFFNIVSLLAIGISGASDETLATRIEEMYAIKDTLTSADYYDITSSLAEEFEELKAIVLRYDALKSEYDITDETVTEEEYQFIDRYATTALILDEIAYGDVSLKEFLGYSDWTIQDLYPVVAALSEGQLALTQLGLFTIVLQYGAPSKPIDELYEMVEEMEADMKDEDGNLEVYDVYLGIDRSIYDGDFAFTTAAERQQALTGIEWTSSYYSDNELWNYIPTTACGIMMGAGVLIGLTPAIAYGIANLAQLIFTDSIACNRLWSRAYNFLFGNAGKVCIGVGIAVVVVAVGVAVISALYGYYNPDYTPIPNNIVDVKETDLGDKYVKYTAAKVHNDEDGRNADFNAYQGKEWIALYYTKDATAGKCLTPKFVYSDSSSTIARRHQGVSMFGETDAFNLNSHVYDGDAPGVYVTMRYSTTKKAAADVPSVVGSMFGGAFYALTTLAGAGLGVGGTLLFQKAKKKKDEDAPEVTVES